MTTLADIRKQNPQYDDLSDEELLSSIHDKYYPDMPRADFDTSLGYKPTAAAAANDQGSLAQQLFDVKNPKTGQSYIYGNTPAPAPYEDVEKIVADTASRGFWDKTVGNAAETQAARARVPDLIEVPLDIGTGVATSPYRIGGMIGGGIWGGAEGAARAYGAQEGWTPEWDKIGQGAATGAALGSGGAALPKAWNAVKGGLNTVGSIPKIVTGGIDMLLHGPYTTLTSGGAKVASKAMPTFSVSPTTRDFLAKAMITEGTQRRP